MQKNSIKLLIKLAEKIAINSSSFGKNSNYSFGISDLNIFAFEVKYSIN
jgi:ribosomal protein L5